jgi:hypothetical protein
MEKLGIRKIGHSPTKIFEKQASNMEVRLRNLKSNIELFPNPEEIYDAIGTDFSDLLQQFSDARKKYSEISTNLEKAKNIRLYELDEMIDELRFLIRQSNRFNRRFEDIIFNETIKVKMKEESLRIIDPIIR